MNEFAAWLISGSASFMFLVIGLRILLDFIIEVDRKIDADKEQEDVREGMTVICPSCKSVLEFDHPSDDGYYWCCKCGLSFPHKNSFPKSAKEWE